MTKYSASARRGFMLAKAIRLTSLITQECAAKLTAAVTNIHDCLKTYMLKTCLLVLHMRMGGINYDLLPEQWTLLIFEQLLEFLIVGEQPILLEVTFGDDKASTFSCEHWLGTIHRHEAKRAQCCDNRLNILSLVTHFYTLWVNYCLSKGIDKNPVDLEPYDHDLHVLPDQQFDSHDMQ